MSDPAQIVDEAETEPAASEPIQPLSERDFRDSLLKVMPSLRAFARGLCGNRDLADDLAQDAMMRAWAARDRYAAGTNFRAWIFIILRNQFYTTLRKNSRQVSWDPEVASRHLIVKENQQDGLHLLDVENALAKLPAEQREVLMLVGAGGIAYEEAAQIMGCAIGTIKSRLARGRAALTAMIDGADADDLPAKSFRAANSPAERGSVTLAS
jgi:RNA polymerase sigma-70 factor, ECF subfamily